MRLGWECPAADTAGDRPPITRDKLARGAGWIVARTILWPRGTNPGKQRFTFSSAIKDNLLLKRSHLIAREILIVVNA